MFEPALLALVQACAPNVAPDTMLGLIAAESTFNPHAIGVVDGRLERQPADAPEGLATAGALLAFDWNFSVGLAQVNRHNFERYGLTLETAFEPCENVRAGAAILAECYARSSSGARSSDVALDQALSCYYSGNFTRGFQPDRRGGSSYVQRVRREILRARTVLDSMADQKTEIGHRQARE